MRKTRVYVDTSVFGGVNDEEFEQPSRRFFERVGEGDFVVLVSREITRELAQAPAAVRHVLTSLPVEQIEEVPIDEEVRALAKAYLDAGIIPPTAEGDAMHVAAATVGRADLILSWNFKHLVCYDRIRKFSGINELNGYPHVDIRSPLEVGYVDDEEQDV